MFSESSRSHRKNGATDPGHLCAAQLQEDCALPFGFTLQPFAVHPHVPLHQSPSVHLKDLARCSECGAYLNCFNVVDAVGFRCHLCGAYNEWSPAHVRKYNRPQLRDKQVELVQQVYEAACPDYDDQVVQDGAVHHALSVMCLLVHVSISRLACPTCWSVAVQCSCSLDACTPFGCTHGLTAVAGFKTLAGPFPAPKKGRPVYIAVVDVAASPSFVELCKLALAATLSALPSNALVGLVTVSDSVRPFPLGRLLFLGLLLWSAARQCLQMALRRSSSGGSCFGA